MTEEPVAKNFSINNMVIEERMRQGQPPPWHEEDERDSTKVDTYLYCIPKVKLFRLLIELST